jgi:hypothetical protein
MPPPPTRAPWALPGGGSGGAAASPLATATSSSGSGSAENEGKLPYRPDFFHLEDGGWVADTARFGEMLATGAINEFERAPSWIVVGRGAFVDIYPWAHKLPQVSK